MKQIVSYGAGINSTAMVCEMVRRGEPIDAIVFADTGGERPETYDHVFDFSAWLVAHGYPAIVTVNKKTKVGDEIVETLEQECLLRKQLPGIAYGFGSCSDKWKQQPFKTWLAAQAWQVVTVCIGFDANEQRRAERGNACKNGYIKRYPLIEFGMGRTECVAAISAAGLKQPGKSACFYCPSSKKNEILSLPKDLQERAIAMEQNADLTSIKGLGRNFSWSDLVYADNAQDKIDFESVIDSPCGCHDG